MAEVKCKWILKRIQPRTPPDMPAKEVRQMEIVLEKGENTLGRAKGNKINCLSILASRKHCTIHLYDNGSLFILDHDSLNKTVINNERIIPDRDTALKDGDIIGIGVDPSVIDNEHPPGDQFIFKISRVKLSQDELESHDERTVVPLLVRSARGKITANQWNCNRPSTSNCGEQSAQIIPSNNVPAPQNVFQKDVEVVNLSSDEEEEVVQLVNKKVSNNTSNSEPGPDNELNRVYDDIIQITDSPTHLDSECKSAEKAVSPGKQVDCPGVTDNMTIANKALNSIVVENIPNVDITDEDLPNIREVDSAYPKHGDKDESLTGKIQEDAPVNRHSPSPSSVTNISFSSVSSEICIQNKAEKLINKNKGDGVSEMQQKLDRHSPSPSSVTSISLSSDSSEICIQNKAEKLINKDKGDGVSEMQQQLDVSESEKENNEGNDSLEIKEESLSIVNTFTGDDEIIFIDDDDDDGELPCSQLFDVNCETGDGEEPLDFNGEDFINLDCWQAGASDDDNDSDTENWFQRLSQSERDPTTSHDENDAEPIDKTATVTEEHVPADLPSEEQAVSSSDENELSEPIFRKIPSGTKRKLSMSSDEETQKEITKSSTKDLRENETSKKIRSHRLSDESNRSIKTKTSDKVKEKAFKRSASHTLIIHSSHAIENLDESYSSTTKNKKQKYENFKEKLSKSPRKISESESSGGSDLEWKHVARELVLPFIEMSQGKPRKNRKPVPKSSKKTQSEEIEERVKAEKIEKSLKMQNKLKCDEKSEDKLSSKTCSSLRKPCGNEESSILIAESSKKKEFLKVDKLNEVTKKISNNTSHKHKTPPIIEPMPQLKLRRKSSSNEFEVVNKKEGQLEPWLSNNKCLIKTQPIYNAAALKEERRKKLKDIAIRDNDDNKKCDRPKCNKLKTKTTNNSRNDMFLQDLVSTERSTVAKGDQPRKEATGTSYKIPRRPSKTEEFDKTLLNREPQIGSNLIEQPLHTSDTNSIEKIIPEKTKKTQVEPSVTRHANVNQMRRNNSNNIQKKNKSEEKDTLIGTENKAPNVIILSEEKYNDMFNNNKNHSPMMKKSLIRQSAMSKCKKKVKFNFSNDVRNTVYVSVRWYEIANGNKLNRVTKTASKVGPGLQTAVRQHTGISYWEETLYFILNWNCSWFEEKKVNTIKDPPVFGGQVYHLSGEFTSVEDYRRGMFPLLLFELWGSVIKQYELVNKSKRRNHLFNIEIRANHRKPVKNKFYATNSTMTLQHLECQVVLDKKQQDIWPRVGDLVVINLQLKESHRIYQGQPIHFIAKEKRVMGYITACPYPKPISSHPDVSPRLMQQCPNGNVVINCMTIVVKGDRAQEIDTNYPAKFIVLKYIKPEQRVFDALDRLALSPLWNKICHPSLNLVNSVIPDPHHLKHLNPSQKKAVMTISKACLERTSSLHLVHGPPGCGKSEVIVNIIMQMWCGWYDQYKDTTDFPQILLCAPSNSAIDDLVIKLLNCRETLKAIGVPTLEVVRVGVPQSTHENCEHLTIDYLTKKELKRLKEVKEDDNERDIELQCLAAKKQKLSLMLSDLMATSRTMTNQPAGNDKRSDISKKIKDIERKIADVTAKIKYLQSGGQVTEREMHSSFKDTQLAILNKANIIATTLSSCYNGLMQEAYNKRFIEFDCCIVDEATQCIEPETLIPLMLGVKKLVLVGDPKQLPATVMTTTAKQYGLEKSLFARHYDWWQRMGSERHQGRKPCHFLNTQYRMHPDIAQWPSKHFYASRLLTQESLRDRSARCPLLPYVVLAHTHNQNPQQECNTEEVKVVKSLIKSIISHPQCRSLNIGVITPYNRQKDELKKEINLRQYPTLEIGTVDSYQGRERDVVIFSCVRTEGVGFLGGQERLNVALTRAKHSLIIVGNFKSLQSEPTWESLLKNAKERNVFRPVTNDHAARLLIFKPGY